MCRDLGMWNEGRVGVLWEQQLVCLRQKLHEDKQVSGNVLVDRLKSDNREGDGNQGSLGWTYSLRAPGEGLCQLRGLPCLECSFLVLPRAGVCFPAVRNRKLEHRPDTLVGKP